MARKKSKRQKKFYGGVVDLGSNINLDGAGGTGRLNIGENATETTAGGGGRINLTGVNNPTTTYTNLSPEQQAAIRAGAAPDASPNDKAAFNMGVQDTDKDGHISDAEFAAWEGYDAWKQANPDGGVKHPLADVKGARWTGTQYVGPDGSTTAPPPPPSGTEDTGTGPDTASVQSDLEAFASGEKTLSDATKITQETLIKDGQMPEGTITGPEDIKQIGDQADVTAGTVPTDVTIKTKDGIVTEAAQPDALGATTYGAQQIQDAAVGEAATGEVSRIAEAITSDKPIDVKESLVSNRDIVSSQAKLVEGVLSQGAFAQAVQAGQVKVDTTGLPQLKDVDIMEPEVQAQVAELPTEALVSTQMDKLLEGMDQGETPSWALPAVSAVEQAMAARGMSASTVGQTALFSAIVSAALPIAQSNATALKERANLNPQNRQQAELTRAQLQTQVDVTEAQLNQQNAVIAFQTDAELRGLDAKLAAEMGVANLNAAQQTAIYNATTQAGMDMANFNNAQQVALANSKWMQTAVLTNANNRQQAALQEATLLASQDLANADALTRVQIENARNFLQMDVSNLSNQQQMEMLNTQNSMQKLLSNQAAVNAGRQFNAASQNQVNTFMANLANQVNLQNAAMTNQMEQFNAQQFNVAALQEAGMEAEAERFNTQLDTQVQQFNAQIDFQRDQWNAANAQAIEQSNVNWRRQANTADTAAANAINQQNAMNSFNLESSALSMLWQQLRDEAAFDQQSYIAYQTNATNLYATALSHENPSSTSFSKIDSIVKTFGAMMSGGT